MPVRPAKAEEGPHYAGQRVLLHICCGPCATYTVGRLRELGFQVTGFWYNPNIHPWQEHERRRESLAGFAEQVELPMLWQPGYEMPAFLRLVAGRERFRRRCAICYAIRLRAAAQQARADGFDAFTTTLLISPYQEQELIRRIGEHLAEREGVRFYFEDFRRGWAERGRLTRLYNLYRQQYCGCIYSEWERYQGEACETYAPARLEAADLHAYFEEALEMLERL
ncbi:MAG: epoxyqueuosine reductase QueH [Anaerolineae bacterium]|nr:epoxyqueuosine reductase QueH [Anaerolineae bacterium]